MKNVGVWIGILIMLFAGLIFWLSLSLDYFVGRAPGPGMFPLWLSGILLVLSVVYIWQSVKKERISLPDAFPKGRELGNVLSIVGSLILFLLIVPFTGYIVAGIVMLFILLVREYKWFWALGISCLLTAVLFFTFDTLLNVPLPVNAFGW